MSETNRQPVVKKQIKITYLCDVDVDLVEDVITDETETMETLYKSIKKRGIKSEFIRDYEIDEVENPFEEEV